jgi:CubicO group peptidase (beta-lactamase class C family)
MVSTYTPIMGEPRLTRVRTSARRLSELFTEQYERGAFSAGQLVVRRSEIVFELCLGHLTTQRNGNEVAERGTPVVPETRFQVMSASKPVVAVAIAMLEEQGLLRSQTRAGAA